MPNKNYAEVMGHLGKDPETRTTASGKSVTELSLATSNDYKGSDGNWIEKPATWWKVTIWGDLGDRASVEFSKGDAVMVRGKVEARAWLSDSGEARVSHELTAKEIFKPIYVSRAKPSEVVAQELVDEHSLSLENIDDLDIPF